MKSTLAVGALAAVTLVALLLLAPGAAVAANCGCYLASDCRVNEYCNWQDGCTRHCELQGAWKPEWGSPPVSKADCDKYIGPCHDNEPQPPKGDDGDGENCEPPNATPPGGGAAINFKVRDGNCATKTVAAEPGDPLPGVIVTTDELVELAEDGGGPVLLSPSSYVDTLMLNVGILALGQYDFVMPQGGALGYMADVRGTCGADALRALGKGLVGEIQVARGAHRRAMRRVDDPIGRLDDSDTPVPSPAREALDALTPACQEWIQSRPHNCEYPHPEAHHHPFDYVDGIDCLAHQLQAMARSLNLR